MSVNGILDTLNRKIKSLVPGKKHKLLLQKKVWSKNIRHTSKAWKNRNRQAYSSWDKKKTFQVLIQWQKIYYHVLISVTSAFWLMNDKQNHCRWSFVSSDSYELSTHSFWFFFSRNVSLVLVHFTISYLFYSVNGNFDLHCAADFFCRCLLHNWSERIKFSR